MEAERLVLLGFAGALAGLVNSMTEGGTLVTYPAVLAAGLSGVVASATTSMSMLPGALSAAWAYRRELAGRRRLLAVLALPSLVGGLLGALLLVSIEERVFTQVVPWCVGAATLLIVAKDVIWRRASSNVQKPSPQRLLVIALCVLGVAVYAGYFGAGKNIMLLALLTFLQRMTISEANALKSAVVALMTLVSSTFFILRGSADLTVVAALAFGTVLGSYSGASVARRLKPLVVRYAVVGIGLSLTGALLYQTWAAA